MPNKRFRGPQPHWRPKRETLRVLTAVDTVLDRYYTPAEAACSPPRC